VPLARQSLEVLDTLHVLTGHTEWLFPGNRNASKQMSNNTILKALERMGYKGTMTGHGFRGLASTILHERGCVHEHIEIQLAHAPRNTVSAAYNHALYLEPRAKMMQEWAELSGTNPARGKGAPISRKHRVKLGVASHTAPKNQTSHLAESPYLIFEVSEIWHLRAGQYPFARPTVVLSDLAESLPADHKPLRRS
jgi:hypothetical protein